MIKKILAWAYVVPLGFLLFGRFQYAVGISALLSCLFWIFRNSGRVRGNKSFIDNMKEYFNLEHVSVKLRKQKPKRVIGGFMIPVLPFFVRIKYPNLQKKLEAIIHELSHVWFMIYGFQITAFFLVIWLATLLDVSLWFKAPLFVAFLLLQEILAFWKTHKVAAAHAIKIRKISTKVLFKYTLLYFVIFYGVLFIFGVLGANWWFVIDIGIMVLYIMLIDRVFWHIFKFIDRLWGKNVKSN